MNYAQQGGRHGKEDDQRRRQDSGIDGGAQTQVDVEAGNGCPLEDLHDLDAAPNRGHQQGSDGGQDEVAGQ